MAGDSRVLMDHNMEIGVTPAQVHSHASSKTNLSKKGMRGRQRGLTHWHGSVLVTDPEPKSELAGVFRPENLDLELEKLIPAWEP